MKITQIKDIQLKRYERDNYCIGKYDITFDDEFKVHNVLLKHIGDKIFLQFPTFRNSKGFRNYANPITREFNGYCTRILVEYYERHNSKVVDYESN